MATADEQLQVNLGVANANRLSIELNATNITWSAKEGGKSPPKGTKVNASICTQFSQLVNQYLKPLYSSSIPLSSSTTTVTNFTKVEGYYSGGGGTGFKRVSVPSLTLWNAQYVTWSIQLPIVLTSAGISADKSQPIINAFNLWYTTNIVPLIPKVSIRGAK